MTLAVAEAVNPNKPKPNQTNYLYNKLKQTEQRMRSETTEVVRPSFNYIPSLLGQAEILTA